MSKTQTLTPRAGIDAASAPMPEPKKAQEHVQPLDGTQYWTSEFMPVFQPALEEALRITQEDQSKISVPWIRSVIKGFGQINTAARMFTTKLEQDTEKIEAGELIDGAHTVTGSVERWYRSLGPTNSSEDISEVLLGVVETLDSQPESTRRDLLSANIIHDVALRSEDEKKKFTLLELASKHYRELANTGDLTDKNVRAGIRHMSDCDHYALRQQLKVGLIDSTTFYKKYEYLQSRSISYLKSTLDNPNHGMGDGELLEWASQIFLRHKYWSQEAAEDHNVRGALLREDEAIYPWRVEHGANPIWSFDTVVEPVDDPEDVQRIQLKVGTFDRSSSRYRSYIPTMVQSVVSQVSGNNLKTLVKNGIDAIDLSYKSMHDERFFDAEIDQSSISSVESIFAEVS